MYMYRLETSDERKKKQQKRRYKNQNEHTFAHTHKKLFKIQHNKNSKRKS